MRGIIIIKATKPTWYKSTVQRLTSYQTLRSRAIYLREEISAQGPKTTPVYSLTPGGGGVGDPSGQLAGILIDKQKELNETEKEIRLIEVAVGTLTPEKKLIIELKYLHENKDVYVHQILWKEHKVKSRNKYYNLKDEAVEELAKTFGELV